ncbi:hypothetical protein FKM82_030292 [Ascaphus truei]
MQRTFSYFTGTSMNTRWRCDNCDIVSSCSDIILSCTDIRSEWRIFSASTIFSSEATTASYVLLDGRFACVTLSMGTSSWSLDCISVSMAASSSSSSCAINKCTHYEMAC